LKYLVHHTKGELLQILLISVIIYRRLIFEETFPVYWNSSILELKLKQYR